MPIPLRLDSRVRIPLSLDSDVLEAIRSGFEHKNPRHAMLQRIGRPAFSEPRVIRTWVDEDGMLTVPRGGLQRVRDALHAADLGWVIEDARCEGAPDLQGRIPPHRMTLWAHQGQAVEAAYARQNCIVRAPTGSGKTTMGFALASRINLPTLVIVPTRGIFDQWVERAQRELGLTLKNIGILQGKTRRIRPLTVAMQKTVAMMVDAGDDEILRTFGGIIGDEVQLFAARTFFAAVDPFPAKWRVGISADERRTDRKEFLIYDIFGSVASVIDRDLMVERGVILDVEIRVIPTDFEAPWYGMPDSDSDDGASGEKEIDFGRLLDEMAADDARNALALEHVQEVLSAGRQVLVMSARREHCTGLDRALVEKGVQTGFLIGGPDYRAEFERNITRMKSGELRVAVGTVQAIGFGIDLPTVGDVVVTTPIAGNKNTFNQVRGRVCRSAQGKSDSRLYYLWDRNVYGVRHLKNLLRWNPTVRVLYRGGWVDARDYLRSMKSA
jgi:superfamily II DNA or RNA helicase